MGCLRTDVIHSLADEFGDCATATAQKDIALWDDMNMQPIVAFELMMRDHLPSRLDARKKCQGCARQKMTTEVDQKQVTDCAKPRCVLRGG